VNKAATNIENARGPVVAVTAPNGSGRDKGRTLDCSARPGRNPSCTEPPKSRLKESANGSVARGVLFAAFVAASVTTLPLTREAFSWKPFESERGRVRSSSIRSKRGAPCAYTPCSDLRESRSGALKWATLRHFSSPGPPKTFVALSTPPPAYEEAVRLFACRTRTPTRKKSHGH
jgi:hypothetical protein